jgi:hypothetical protein
MTEASMDEIKQELLKDFEGFGCLKFEGLCYSEHASLHMLPKKLEQLEKRAIQLLPAIYENMKERNSYRYYQDMPLLTIELDQQYNKNFKRMVLLKSMEVIRTWKLLYDVYIIFSYFKDHVPLVEEIFDCLRLIMPKITMATFYSSLSEMVDWKSIDEILLFHNELKNIVEKVNVSCTINHLQNLSRIFGRKETATDVMFLFNKHKSCDRLCERCIPTRVIQHVDDSLQKVNYSQEYDGSWQSSNHLTGRRSNTMPCLFVANCSADAQTSCIMRTVRNKYCSSPFSFTDFEDGINVHVYE